MTHIVNVVTVTRRVNEMNSIIDIFIESKYNIFNSKQYVFFKKIVLAGVAQWTEHRLQTKGSLV